jgi:hypothetical protein
MMGVTIITEATSTRRPSLSDVVPGARSLMISEKTTLISSGFINPIPEMSKIKAATRAVWRR